MPFPNNYLPLGTICRRVAEGRRLARQLALVVREHAMNETEFRLLWLLRETEGEILEQSTLVEELGISPAQVSALVEKLRSQQILDSGTDRNDRRRKLWQLTASSRENFEAVIASVESRLFSVDSEIGSHSQRKDAA